MSRAATLTSRGTPLIVTNELIEVFERNNPALAGIGAIMLEEGHWVLDGNENSDTMSERASAPDRTRTSDAQQHGGTANVTRLYTGKVY